MEEELFTGLFVYDEIRDYINDYTSRNIFGETPEEQEWLRNAFARAFASAVYAQSLGTFGAWALGGLREIRTVADYYYLGGEVDEDGVQFDPRVDTWIDMYNNMAGRQIGRYAGEQDLSWEEIAALVVDALAEGVLISQPRDERVPSEIVDDPTGPAFVGLVRLLGRDDETFTGWPFDFYTSEPPNWRSPEQLLADEEERHRLAEVEAEREQRRVAMLQSIGTSAQQIDRTGSGYERNRALVELQDAINDYTLFYGSDPAAMAAVQPYQQALAQLWDRGQPQQPGLITVPGGGYTGVDITVPPVLDDIYDSFRANPAQQSAPYTGVEVVAPTLRDSTADLFRANTPTMPATGQPTSAMGSGAYSAMLPTFDFSQPLGIGSIPPIAPVLPSVRQSSASTGTQMTPPTFASSPLAQAAMGVPSPLGQYGQTRQSTMPDAGYRVPVTPLQFGVAPALQYAKGAVPGAGLGVGLPVTPPAFSWSPLEQPPMRDAAKGSTGNGSRSGRSAGKYFTATSSQPAKPLDSDPTDVWMSKRIKQVETKNALPNDKNTPEEWVKRRYAELARKRAFA